MRAPTFRRSPHIVSYWDDGQLIFHNYAAGTQLGADALSVSVLEHCATWHTANAVAASLPSHNVTTIRRVLERLARAEMVERSDRPRDRARARALAGWTDWNPSVGLFHFSTRDIEYETNPGRAERALRREARKHPPPAPVKRYRNAERTRLPPPRTDEFFTPVLTGRRTWRRFARRRIAMADFATLLGLTFGVQRWAQAYDGSQVVYKTSPSGGARQPYEAYALVLNVDGVPRGLYHYAADIHALELLKRGSSARQIAAYIPGQWWYRSAAAIVFMTAVFPRVQWRYPFPRAYRSVLVEAGHFCQTFCLVATWLRLAPFCTLMIADSRLERDLGVDGVNESFIYAAGVGSRPDGVEEGPWPEHRRGNPFLPPERRRSRP